MTKQTRPPIGHRSSNPVGPTDPTGAHRWMRSLPLFTAGGASVVAGGMAAAVTGPMQWGHGSWVAAFLVLVAGVAQIGIGAGQAHLGLHPPIARFISVQCAMWNTGCALVIAGTLMSSPVIVFVGSAPLVAVLGLSAVGLRATQARRSVLSLLYRMLLAVLATSIPIGLALAWTGR